MQKTALITGVTGQDGSYLAELLLQKGYKVHGIKRRASSINTLRIDHLYNNPNFKLHYGDLTDSLNLVKLLNELRPDEIYNLGAMSHVAVSTELPEYTYNANAMGAVRLLEAIKILGLKNTKFYQASTSEMFGKVQQVPQTETTPFYPRSPYAIAKLSAYWSTINYREAYGTFASNGILFNHESKVRGETFVTRKIIRGLLSIIMGKADCLYLGNLDAERDWGHAADYARAMYLIMQHTQADDFVIATGKKISIRQFIGMVCDQLEIRGEWEGAGEDEHFIWHSCPHYYKMPKNTAIIKIDPKYFRPTEVDELLGDATKAKTILGWEPKYTLEQMITEMIEHDRVELKNK